MVNSESHQDEIGVQKETWFSARRPSRDMLRMIMLSHSSYRPASCSIFIQILLILNAPKVLEIAPEIVRCKKKKNSRMARRQTIGTFAASSTANIRPAANRTGNVYNRWPTGQKKTNEIAQVDLRVGEELRLAWFMILDYRWLSFVDLPLPECIREAEVVAARRSVRIMRRYSSIERKFTQERVHRRPIDLGRMKNHNWFAQPLPLFFLQSTSLGFLLLQRHVWTFKRETVSVLILCQISFRGRQLCNVILAWSPGSQMKPRSSPITHKERNWLNEIKWKFKIKSHRFWYVLGSTDGVTFYAYSPRFRFRSTAAQRSQKSAFPGSSSSHFALVLVEPCLRVSVFVN